MTILHITNWYPNVESPTSAIWIKRHIESLQRDCTNKIYHLEVRKGRLGVLSGRNQDGSYYRIFNIPILFWRLIELISLITILFILRSNRKSKIDIINFHIAYPNCTYVKFIRKLVKCPIVITEHWSGYHYNFNIPNPKKRRKIQKIFHHNIPVITVSKALKKDIEKFSGAQFPGYIVQNIVDTSIFHYASHKKIPNSYLMISQWKWPKDPFTVVKAWSLLLEHFPNAILKIGGYGQQYDKLKDLIIDLRLQNNVFLIGLLNSNEVAHEMQISRAFIHCSEYETFSVVCAEALCCGTPVIASKVGGIMEYVNDSNGILVADNDPNSFLTSILKFQDKDRNFDRIRNSEKAILQFTQKKIGIDYLSALNEVISH